jgi:site-specific DNA-methyltransferase (adenine-specific)
MPALSSRPLGRGVAVAPAPQAFLHRAPGVHLSLGDSLSAYPTWDTPTVIVSDGAYGIQGFEGDTADADSLPDWYAPHIDAWSARATGRTTLWFWNTEVGWATVHPLLQQMGWRYISLNIWNKGKGHIAGNVNTGTLRRFPVVTEVCAQYVYVPTVDGLSLRAWLHREWKRTGLPMRLANTACGVKDVATRKYLDQGRLWYFPPPPMFARLVDYANTHGDPAGRPYFSADGQTPLTEADWRGYRSPFHCPMGHTNVWDRPALHGAERIRVPELGKQAAHLNQKPLDLMERIIAASSDPGDVVWEPFGGLFSASLAAQRLGRQAFASELHCAYYRLGIGRFPDLSDALR